MWRPDSHAALLANFFLCTLASSLSVLFGLFKFIYALDIRFYYSYSPQVVNIAVFSPSIDFWMWIVSFLFIILEMFLTKTLFNPRIPPWTVLPLFFSLASFAIFLISDRVAYLLAVPLVCLTIGLLIYYGNGYLVTGREEAASLLLVCIAGLLILFEVASVSSWVFNAFDYQVPFGYAPRWVFPRIDLQLFNVLYPLTSWLFLLFLYSWIWIAASKYIISKVATLRHLLLRFERTILSPAQNTDAKLKLNNKYLILGLLLSLTTAVFVAYYPYIHASGSTLVGSDAVNYLDWLREMAQKGPLTALETNRPFTNLMMYSIQVVTRWPPETVIRIMPIILAVGLCLVVFWFVKVGTRNEFLALLSSLFSSLSFQTTVGVFASYLANWLAIIESFLLLVFLLKSFEKRSWKYVSVSALIGMTLLLTHPYTWDVLISILAFCQVWAFFRRKSNKKVEIIFLTFLLASNLVFYAAYAVAPFGKGVSSATGATLHDVTGSISISNFLNLQNNLASMVQAWVGGLFGNPLLLVLAVVGVFSMFDFRKNFNRIMLLWVIIPSLALLVVPPDPYYYRFIYLVPIQVQAAAGLTWTVTKLESVRDKFKTSETFHMAITSIIVLVLLLLLNYALRSVDEAIIHIL